MYLDPSDDSIRALLDRDMSSPIVMLNLLRLRAIADYWSHPDLAPGSPITGKQAYQKYIEQTKPHLAASGGSIVLLGDDGQLFIGPSDEKWDVVMLVQQASLQDFFSFAGNDAYLAGMGHRIAAVEDARLLPVSLPSPTAT